MPGAAVVGHSLGGVLATLYGDRHPETPAVVNLDGHGPGRPEQYVGLEPDTVRQRLADARPYAMGSAGRTYDEDAFEITRMQQVAWATVNARNPTVVEEGLRRSLAGPDENGLFRVRPDLANASDMLAAIERLDLFEIYRRIPCPLLVVRAERPDPLTEMVRWLHELLAAYAKGLARDLEDLEAFSPHVTVASIDATHAMLLDRPEEVAQMILSFVARARPASS
jgi:pimeloyl-ACP methyl ester carboxylesterase